MLHHSRVSRIFDDDDIRSRLDARDAVRWMGEAIDAHHRGDLVAPPRAHADLGTNWSITLEVREKHQLVTHGIYRWVRHPMYLALFLYSAGQALVLPNWLVGPSYGFAMVLLFALRVGREERMMHEEFGKDYEAYAATTRRLLPGIW